MKKVLLFTMALGLMMGAFAQNQYVAKKNQKLAQEGISYQGERVLPALNQNKSVNEDVNRVYIGKSINQRGVRREDTHVMSYNKDINTISVTCAIDPATYPDFNAGELGQFYSTDGGQTWQGPVLLAETTGGFDNYYPSGIIYNPLGNTNVADAYGISQSTNTNWTYSIFGKNKLGGGDQATYFIEDASNIYNGYWNQFGMNQYGADIRALNVYVEGDWAVFTHIELNPIFGEYNSGEFTFDMSNLVDLNLADDELGETRWAGKFVGNDAGVDMVWSNDGQIGYMWLVSVSADEPTGYQPIIAKTTDAGGSWDIILLDFFTDEMQAFLEPYIIESSSGLMIPYVKETAGAVDHHGDLQMYAVFGSHSADLITYPDSTDWSWGYPGDLFNITIDDNGIKDIMWIDSLFTEDVPQDDPLSYNGSGWQHRLSVAKNEFENEIFLTWTDTRDVETFTINAQPDIFGWSKNYHTGDVNPVVCFTEGTLYETFYFFTYGADKAIYHPETQTYTIPYMNGVTPGEFSGNGSATADPISYDYVSGIEFPALGDYVSVNEIAKASGIKVAQNQPNPFNGTTTIEVNSATVAPVMVEVSNLMGQTVYTINAGTINGTKNVTLTSDNLEAGVYFYTVRIGSESVTKKMIVE